MPRVKTLRGDRVVTNVLGSSAASKPTGHSSFIALWRAETGLADAPCFAKGCPNRGTHGGHVKLASSPLAGALLSFDWFIVPACPTHNKGASCGSYAVKANTKAVRCNPTVLERVAALPADGRKLVAACLGKHHI